MDWAIFLGVTLGASAIVALVARDIAQRMARAGGEPEFTAILLAIVISAVLLLGASRLAIGVDWLFAQAGVEADAALFGQFRVLAFAASFVPIAAYVLTFLLTFRREKGNT